MPVIPKSKRIDKATATELKKRIDKIVTKLPNNYTSRMMTVFPKRYNKGNVYMLYNVVAKRRLDEQIITDLEKICQ